MQQSMTQSARARSAAQFVQTPTEQEAPVSLSRTSSHNAISLADLFCWPKSGQESVCLETGAQVLRTDKSTCIGMGCGIFMNLSL